MSCYVAHCYSVAVLIVVFDLSPELSVPVRVAANVQSICQFAVRHFRSAKFQSVIVQSCNLQFCKFSCPTCLHKIAQVATKYKNNKTNKHDHNVE